MDSLVARVYDSPLTLAAVTASLASLGYVVFQRLKNPHSLGASKSAPGPPRQFLIGNLRQFPQNNFHERFAEWQKDYGDIISVDIFGIPIVVINSYEIAHELLDKHPNTTSGRNISYMCRELMGWHWSLAFMQAESAHGNQRKMLRRGIGPQRVGSHDPRIERSANQLMLLLQDLEGHPHPVVMSAIGKLVNEVAYGEKVLAVMAKELPSWGNEAMELLIPAFSSFWLVDVFNFVRFIPSWMPGAEFRRIGARSTWLTDRIRNVPYAKARELYQSGEIDHSLVTDLLDEFGPNDDARDALGILYTVGADTTSGAIMAFILALYLFPDISKKVYEEIITVTDGTRMPSVADRSKMPYTEAVWKEAFRWEPFLPMGIPHVNSRDEIVNGYIIKSGSQIITNLWAMMMDPKVWGDPDTFRPERFLGPEADSLPNPLVAMFGYGMRLCPGMYLADRVGFHVSATVAAVYDVVPLEGRSRPKSNSIKFSDGAVRTPIGVECRFISRDRRSLDLLRVAVGEE